MKKIAFALSLLLLAGCANNKTQEQPALSEEASVSKKKPMIEVTSGSVSISIQKPYYAYVEDVVIDIAQDGRVFTTYTDVYSGNRVTVEGDCRILNLQSYEIRDWTQK